MHPANRLSRERSPYLLQHAHNPVDWYPWGEEAFDKAGREDKPVFLSVGYSACHWCHVMERESFEDERTARLLNEHFVSIKVDREERPDVDQIYQLAHQVLTQRAGGWPLSMFLLPDKRPFFGGTYFPDARRHGMPSFTDVLQAILEAYQSRRGDVDGQAAELLRVLVRVTTAPAAPGAALEAAALEAAALDDAAVQALRRAEKTYGGFGRAPKFPNTMALDVLLCAGALRGHEEARGHALLTLDRMARGGIYDQLGGGFARYSTDERWLVPHFEKMLYDNAQLARLYLDGWRALGDRAPGEHPRERYRAVVAEVLAYVLREMTDPAGVFYSAQDADSEGEEGKFFVWTPAEVEAVVGKDDAPRVCAYFDVTAEGNFEDHKSVLWTPRPLDEVARAVGGSPDEITRAVERARPLLFAARERRPKPARDDKCLASWNALMISALADAGATLAEPSWVAAAEAALDAWRARAWCDGRLAHAIKQGEAYGAAFLDDYAGLARAAIDVYEATFDPRHLGFARALCDATLDLFSDDAAGDLFFTPRDGEVVLHRTKDASDHAYPGGVGLAADALLRLGALTGVPRYRDAAERLLGTTAQAARESPLGFGSVTRAVDRAARGGVEVVVVGDAARDETRALLRAAREVYVPHRTLVCVADEPDGARHGIDPALVRGRAAGAGGTPTAYVCRAGVCAAPVGTPEALVAALRAAVGGV